MRVTMLQTHNFINPEIPGRTTRYREGRGYTVKQAHGERLVALGVAKEAKAPKRRGNPENLGDWDNDKKPGGDAGAKNPKALPTIDELTNAEAASVPIELGPDDKIEPVES